MLELRHATMPAGPAEPRAAGIHGDDPTWEPPIVRTVAVRDQGLSELAAKIDCHRAHLEAGGGKLAREAIRARAEFLAILKERVMTSALRRLAREQGELSELATRIARREANPWALAEDVASRLL